jgi:heme/copper-type cytochrome/quinol oxidase subunit 2
MYTTINMNALLFPSVSDGHLEIPRLNVGVIFAGLVMATLVYLTALQWNAALSLSIQKLQQKHQELDEEEAAYIVASSISVFVIVVTLIVYFALRKRTHRHKKKRRSVHDM